MKSLLQLIVILLSYSSSGFALGNAGINLSGQDIMGYRFTPEQIAELQYLRKEALRLNAQLNQVADANNTATPNGRGTWALCVGGNVSLLFAPGLKACVSNEGEIVLVGGVGAGIGVGIFAGVGVMSMENTEEGTFPNFAGSYFQESSILGPDMTLGALIGLEKTVRGRYGYSHPQSVMLGAGIGVQLNAVHISGIINFGNPIRNLKLILFGRES